MCVLISSTSLSETFVVIRRMQRDMIINVYGSSCTVQVIMVRFSQKLDFLDRFSKKDHVSNFMKIRPVGAHLFRTDGQTASTRSSLLSERVRKPGLTPIQNSRFSFTADLTVDEL